MSDFVPQELAAPERMEQMTWTLDMTRQEDRIALIAAGQYNL